MGRPTIHRKVRAGTRRSRNLSETTWRTPRHGRGKTICLRKSSWWLRIYYKAGQIIWGAVNRLVQVATPSRRGAPGLLKLTMRQNAFAFRLGKSVECLHQPLLLCLKCLDVVHDVANALLHHRIVKLVQGVKQRAPNRHVR